MVYSDHPQTFVHLVVLLCCFDEQLIQDGLRFSVLCIHLCFNLTALHRHFAELTCERLDLLLIGLLLLILLS